MQPNVVRVTSRCVIGRPGPRRIANHAADRSWLILVDGEVVGRGSDRVEAEAHARRLDVQDAVIKAKEAVGVTIILSGERAWVVTPLGTLPDCRLASYRGLDGFRLWWIPEEGLPFPASSRAFSTETLARCEGLRICGASPLRAATSEDLKLRSERASVLLAFVGGREGFLRDSDVPSSVLELLGDISESDLRLALETFPRNAHSRLNPRSA